MFRIEADTVACLSIVTPIFPGSHALAMGNYSYLWILKLHILAATKHAMFVLSKGQNSVKHSSGSEESGSKTQLCCTCSAVDPERPSSM